MDEQVPAPVAPVDPYEDAAPDDDWVILGTEGRVPRWLVGLGVLIVVLGLVAGACWVWYQRQVDPPGSAGAAVEVSIPEGATTSRVADILDNEGVITSATLFGFYANGKDLSGVQAGTYTFQENSSFDEAIAVLGKGPDTPAQVSADKVNVPEGLTQKEVVARIGEKVPRFTPERLQAALDEGKVTSSLKPDGTSSWEGLLFPATYEVTDEDTEADLLQQMADEMASRAGTLGIEDAAQAISTTWGIQVTPYDVLKVASLVQEEAGSAEEAPKVATVIYNRLAQDWALGIDATSRYLAELEGTDVDFESTSPYNTRRQAGLPPTPIANPGEYALDAAMHPADGPWMYYVLTDPGVHTFVVTDAEFQDAKQECIAKDLGCG